MWIWWLSGWVRVRFLPARVGQMAMRWDGGWAVCVCVTQHQRMISMQSHAVGCLGLMIILQLGFLECNARDLRLLHTPSLCFMFVL